MICFFIKYNCIVICALVNSKTKLLQIYPYVERLNIYIIHIYIYTVCKKVTIIILKYTEQISFCNLYFDFIALLIH